MMKNISRSPVNGMLFFYFLITVFFIFLLFVKGENNLLLIIILYLVSLLIARLIHINNINDILYNSYLLIIKNKLTGTEREFEIKNMKKLQLEAISVAGPQLAIYTTYDEKFIFGYKGCDSYEIDEMVKFINTKIEDSKNGSKSK